MKQKLFLCMVLFLFSASILKCNSEDEIVTPPEQYDLVQPSEGQYDTGYLSNIAWELDGEFSGVLLLDLSESSQEGIDYLTEAFENGYWEAEDIMMQQIEFSKLQLNEAFIHLNLYTSTFKIESLGFNSENKIMTVVYRCSMESVVTKDELDASKKSIENIINTNETIRVPADPRNIFEQAGESCAEGFTAGELANYNYFYYFAPDKSGCNINFTDATYSISVNLASPETTYPEYDKLIEDNKITVAVFFGAAQHNEQVASNDEGVREWTEFVSFTIARGFVKTEDLNPGQRFKRTRNGIEEIIDVISPYDLHALSNDTDGIFTKAVQEHEIILYNGHSFYGSLDVLQNRNAFPVNTYQIFFMDSCWSYEYYTKQIFENKSSTENGQDGWTYADVVNNTEPGWFLNNAEESRILLTNIFAGAETGGIDSEGHYYTWANIIAAMNKWSIDIQKAYNLNSHEIFGVSGVRNNNYNPEGDNEIQYTNSTPDDIPDAYEQGVNVEFNITHDFIPSEIFVEVNITHSYSGDIKITLIRNDVEYVIKDANVGVGDDNIIGRFRYEEQTPSIQGQGLGLFENSINGNWTVNISDLYTNDIGTLNSCSLIFIP